MSVKLRNANPASELITARKSRFAAGAEWPECVDHGVLETRISMRAKVGAALDCVKHATPSNVEALSAPVVSVAAQLRALSTSLFLPIHGIIALSFAPTSSIGCAFTRARVALNEVWLTLFSSIQSRVKRPD